MRDIEEIYTKNQDGTFGDKERIQLFEEQKKLMNNKYGRRSIYTNTQITRIQLKTLSNHNYKFKVYCFESGRPREPMITNFKTKDNMGIITTINITFSAYLEQDYQPDALQAILCTISTLVPAKYSRVTDEFGGIC